MRSRSLRLDACLRSTRSGVADLGKDMWGFTNVPVRTVPTPNVTNAAREHNVEYYHVEKNYSCLSYNMHNDASPYLHAPPLTMTYCAQ